MSDNEVLSEIGGGKRFVIVGIIGLVVVALVGVVVVSMRGKGKPKSDDLAKPANAAAEPAPPPVAPPPAPPPVTAPAAAEKPAEKAGAAQDDDAAPVARPQPVAKPAAPAIKRHGPGPKKKAGPAKRHR